MDTLSEWFVWSMIGKKTLKNLDERGVFCIVINYQMQLERFHVSLKIGIHC